LTFKTVADILIEKHQKGEAYMILTMLGVNGPYPSIKGACSGYLLTSDSGRTRILIDCGSGVLGRLLNECTVRDLSAVVLSHLHFDHMSDMLPMNYLLSAAGVECLKVICPKTPEKVRRILEDGALDLYPTQDMMIGEMKLEFLRVAHPVETYAVRVICDGKTFVYTGDTNECDALTLFAAGADLLMLFLRMIGPLGGIYVIGCFCDRLLVRAVAAGEGVGHNAYLEVVGRLGDR